MSSEPTTLPYPVLDYTKQSLPVPGTKRPGQTAHYRNAAFGLIGHETTDALAPLTTCTAIFDKGLRLSKDKPFLGHRPVLSTKPLTFAPHFVWETYSQVDQRRRNVGSALLHSFQTGELGGGELNTVGIWSQNRPEWQIIDIALQGYGLVGVSLYDTLGRDSVEYIINHAHLTVIFATSQHIPTLLKLAPKVPILKLIVSIDDLSAESKSILTTWAGVQNVQVKELRDIEELGKLHPAEPTSAKPSDIVSLCYTSGTTNNPKGVVLKHGNLASAVRSNLYGSPFEDDATLLSYLPLAHIYERLTESCVISVGGRIGYFTGDPLRLLEDAQILRPHLFPSVPRVLNRVYQSAMAAADVPGPKGTLFRKAVQVKLDRLHTTGDNTHAFWDRLVFRKIQAVLGGNVKMVTSGSAPISVDVMDFLKIALACDVLEGYGMTENCGTCTKVLPLDPSSSGTVGPPQPVNEVKLVDVPAMGYTSEDSPNPRGELCVRGANCFNVYYKDEKNTKETVDEEGWIHTGDVAEIDQHGRVKIVDRVKNIMKLAQGEYVALEKIENVYGSTPVVGQIYIHGDSLQSYLLAVIVPDPLQLSTLGEKLLGRKVSPEDAAGLAELAADSKVNAAILAILTKEAKRHGLKGFETVKRIHVATEPFSVENGTMTPTFKIRRKDAYNLYKSQLDGLYALGEPESSKL